MRCFECRYLDRSEVLTCYPPKYYCTYDNTTHFADDECKYEHYPIVRCKDCKYAEHRKQMPNQIYCHRDTLSLSCSVHDDDDYCKWAKMKGGNE